MYFSVYLLTIWGMRGEESVKGKIITNYCVLCKHVNRQNIITKLCLQFRNIMIPISISLPGQLKGQIKEFFPHF